MLVRPVKHLANRPPPYPPVVTQRGLSIFGLTNMPGKGLPPMPPADVSTTLAPSGIGISQALIGPFMEMAANRHAKSSCLDQGDPELDGFKLEKGDPLERDTDLIGLEITEVLVTVEGAMRFGVVTHGDSSIG